jgi:hypothetical protein
MHQSPPATELSRREHPGRPTAFGDGSAHRLPIGSGSCAGYLCPIPKSMLGMPGHVPEGRVCRTPPAPYRWGSGPKSTEGRGVPDTGAWPPEAACFRPGRRNSLGSHTPITKPCHAIGAALTCLHAVDRRVRIAIDDRPPGCMGDITNHLRVADRASEIGVIILHTVAEHHIVILVSE